MQFSFSGFRNRHTLIITCVKNCICFPIVHVFLLDLTVSQVVGARDAVKDLDGLRLMRGSINTDDAMFLLREMHRRRTDSPILNWGDIGKSKVWMVASKPESSSYVLTVMSAWSYFNLLFYLSAPENIHLHEKAAW